MFVLFMVASILPSYLCQGPALFVDGELGHQQVPVTGVHPSGPLGPGIAEGQTPPYHSPAYVGSFGGQQHQQHQQQDVGHVQEHHGAPAGYHGAPQAQHVSEDGDESDHGPETAHDGQDGYEPSSDDGKDGPRNSYSPSEGDRRDPYGGPNEIGQDDYGYDTPHRTYGSDEDNGSHHGPQQSDEGDSYHGSEGTGGDHYGSRRPQHASGYDEPSPRSRRRHRIRQSHHEPSEHHGHSEHHGPPGHHHRPAQVHDDDSSYHGAPRHHHQPHHHHHQAHSQGHSGIEGHSLHGGHPHAAHGPRSHRSGNLNYRQMHGNGDIVIGKPVKLTDDSMYGLTLSPLVLPQRPVVLSGGLQHGFHPQVVDLTQAAPMAHYDLTPTMAGAWMVGASPFINTAHLKS